MAPWAGAWEQESVEEWWEQESVEECWEQESVREWWAQEQWVVECCTLLEDLWAPDQLVRAPDLQV
jgi:hypothetical protein